MAKGEEKAKSQLITRSIVWDKGGGGGQLASVRWRRYRNLESHYAIRNKRSFAWVR